jgi:hypothetical protein
LEVIISAGRQDVIDAVLNLTEADEAMEFDMSMATLIESQGKLACSLTSRALGDANP